MSDESSEQESKSVEIVNYFVDEAGDGVLFGPRGRNRLEDNDARRFFILGMVRLADQQKVEGALKVLRSHLLSHPLYVKRN